MATHKKHIILDGKKYLLKRPTAFQRSAVVPWARKMGGGDTRHSSYDKWSVRARLDTHVGRAEFWDEGQDGRFLDSDKVDTRFKGLVVLGSMPTFIREATSTPGREVQLDHTPGDQAWWGRGSIGYQGGEPTAFAQSFTLPSAINCDAIAVFALVHSLVPVTPHWAWKYIMTARNHGVVIGYPDGYFYPEEATSRAQFCTMIYVAKGWVPDLTGAPHFSDVPPTHWAYTYIETCYNKGVITGYGDGTFRPDNAISRAEACVIIVAAMAWANDESGSRFPDVPPTHWAFSYIMTARNHGVVGGYPDGYFRPNNALLRSEACVMIVVALAWIIDTTGTDFPDVAPYPSDITFALYTDTAGNPGTLLKSKTITGVDFFNTYGVGYAQLVTVVWASVQALAAATTYWLVISTPKEPAVWAYGILFDMEHLYANGLAKEGKLGGPWTAMPGLNGGIDMCFIIYGTITGGPGPMPGDLDGEVVDICEFYDTVNGLSLYVLAGTKVYRLNPSTMKLIDEAAGLTGLGVCMKQFGANLFVSQGNAGSVRAKISTGSWGDASGAWKAGRMAVAPNLDGDLALWVQGTAAVVPDSTWSVRSSIDGGTFSDWISCDFKSAITFIGYYAGETWVANQHEIGLIDRATKKYTPQFQFPTQRHTSNFASSCVWHKNDLMLNIYYSVWHWNMGSQFRHIGPGAGVGMPWNRAGTIGAMLPRVNDLLVAIDGGNDVNRYSTILSYNGIGDVGWHELFRTWNVNERIRALCYTPSGALLSTLGSRIWFGCGKSLGMLGVPDATDNPSQWAGLEKNFHFQGQIIYPWFDGLLRDVDKDWGEITVGCHYIDDETFIDVMYRTDMASEIWAEGKWRCLGTIGSPWNVTQGKATVSPVKQQATLEFPAGTYDKLIQIALIPRTENSAKTPWITMCKLKWWPVPDPVNSWAFILNLIGWEDPETGRKREWKTQRDEFWTTYYKKEPVTLVEIYGDEWIVRLDPPPRENPIIRAATDMPEGCEIQVWAIEARLR